MRTRNVIVVPYNANWKSNFEKIRAEIESALGDLVICVEHIGSTSVEGLSAKPIIDIDVVIKDYSVFDAVVKKLEAIGYIYEGNQGVKDREAFMYKDKPHLQAHHLYVCPQASEELYRHIAFREYLRNNLDAVKKYSAVKEKAAQLFPNDIDAYIKYIDIKETIAFECRGGGCKFAPSMRPSNDDSDCVGQATNHINGGT